MFKLFGQKNQSNQENQSGELRVIGDLASGKTTYMAALARWPNANPSSPVETVTAINKNGEDLIKQAQNLLEQGLVLEQNPGIVQDFMEEVKDYSLKIVLKKKFSPQNSQNFVNLDISCKDYSGEFFSDLLNQPSSPILKDYLEDCLLAKGIILLIDGTANRQDSQYARSVDKLLVALDRSALNPQKRRIALVVSKCEIPELWVNRHKPRFVAEARFGEVCKRLEAWQRSGAGKVEYFTVSAFGVLGHQYPKPNSKRISRNQGGTASVLAEPKKWRPFGLVSPIYWLCTGKRNNELND